MANTNDALMQLLGAAINYNPGTNNQPPAQVAGQDPEAERQKSAQAAAVKAQMFPAAPQVGGTIAPPPVPNLGFGTMPPPAGNPNANNPTNFPGTPQGQASVVDHFANAAKVVGAPPAPNVPHGTNTTGGLITQLNPQQGNAPAPAMPAAPVMPNLLPQQPNTPAALPTAPAPGLTPSAAGAAPTSAPIPTAAPPAAPATAGQPSWLEFFKGGAHGAGMTGNSYTDIQARKAVAADTAASDKATANERIAKQLGVTEKLGLANAGAIAQGAQTKRQAALDIEAERTKRATTVADKNATTKTALSDAALKQKTDAETLRAKTATENNKNNNLSAMERIKAQSAQKTADLGMKQKALAVKAVAQQIKDIAPFGMPPKGKEAEYAALIQKHSALIDELHPQEGAGAATPKPLDVGTAQQFLKQAGGDKAKARELAAAQGYAI